MRYRVTEPHYFKGVLNPLDGFLFGEPSEVEELIALNLVVEDREADSEEEKGGTEEIPAACSTPDPEIEAKFASADALKAMDARELRSYASVTFGAELDPSPKAKVKNLRAEVIGLIFEAKKQLYVQKAQEEAATAADSAAAASNPVAAEAPKAQE
jgi:hypothetical protein